VKEDKNKLPLSSYDLSVHGHKDFLKDKVTYQKYKEEITLNAYEKTK